VSDFVRRAKGRSSHKVQREFPDLKKRYWEGVSGREAILVQQVVRLPMKRYFSILTVIQTNLPTSVGSDLVSLRMFVLGISLLNPNQTPIKL